MKQLEQKYFSHLPEQLLHAQYLPFPDAAGDFAADPGREDGLPDGGRDGDFSSTSPSRLN